MAARTEQRRFGSYDLTEANGIILAEAGVQVLHRARFTPRLKAHGSLVTADRFEGAVVELGGIVRGTDTGEARDRVDGLLAALAGGEDWLQLYSDRRIRCRLEGSVDVRMRSGTQGTVFDWDVAMRSRWPWAEGTSQVVDAFTPTGAGPHTLTTAVVAGDAPTWPTITITNNGSGFSSKTLTLTIASTLKQLQLVGLSMTAGQSVVVDMREGRLGDGIAGAVTPHSVVGQWWEMPAAAAATIELAHTVGAGASWGVQVAHYPNHWAL